jgi:hypothetical protein
VEYTKASCNKWFTEENMAIHGQIGHSKAKPILHYPTFTFITIDYKKVTAGLQR